MHRSLPFFALFLAACTGDGEGPSLNLFTVEDDKELGQQVRDEILADSANYPVVDRASAPEAYGHLERIRDEILDSGDVQNRDVFEWEVYLIDDDATLNAFATPGGYLFYYTGLIRYLETEDHFAGVMGHEIAHAARRHSSQQLTQQYGVATLLEIVFGEDQGGTAGEIAQGLAGLQFSRSDESDADIQSVVYLCDGPKAADGAAGFFEKLLEDGSGSNGPAFLSTHPSSETRVEDIHNEAETRGCNLTPDAAAQWAEFQASLP